MAGTESGKPAGVQEQTRMKFKMWPPGGSASTPNGKATPCPTLLEASKGSLLTLTGFRSSSRNWVKV